MILKRLLTFLLLFSGLCTFAQNVDWRNYNSEGHQNFYDIQAAFENEMGNIPYEKGKGIKQFRRWEYYWESRVNPDGSFPSNGNVLNEMLTYKANHLTAKSYVNGSGTWTLIGPKNLPNNLTGQLNGNGRLNCIAFHPTDTNILYVGAPAGGLWKTIDHGATWTEYSSGLVRLGVSSIVVHPTNPDTLYIGTGDRDANDAPGYGVWRSVDGGVTWVSHNTGMGNVTINEIIMDPTDSDKMVAAAANGYVYRTNDGGVNWNQSNFLGVVIKDIAIHPTNSSIVYAAGSEFFKSTNGGQTFSQITNGVPSNPDRMAIAVSPDEPSWVYILAGDGSGLVGIYRSINSGTSFTTRTSSPNILGYQTDGSGNDSQAWYDLVLVADPLNADIIYTGGVNLWKSIDGGINMDCVSYWVGSTGSVDGVHADQHALEFSPHNNILYNGNDGGIYYTDDEGNNWEDISSGLAIAQIYKIGVSSQTPNLVITGFQDNGTGYATGYNAFNTILGGDGMECIIDPTDDDYIYGALYYGDIRRSSNGGNNFSNISNTIPEDGAWVTPYKLDPNNENIMLVGMENVFRNSNVKNNDVWTQITNFSGASTIRDLAIAPSNSDVVYVSRRGNKLYKSTNASSANPSWSDISGNLPVNDEPLDIEIDPTDPNHVYIALNNNIYESSNGGASWIDISGTLPNISLNTIVIDKESSVGALYVGMDVGVYYKDDNLTDWVTYQTNLPNVEVTELEIQYDNVNCDSKIVAATYGQGAWMSDLKDPGGVAPIACFSASKTIVCTGVEIVLTDHSNFTPTQWAWSVSPSTFQYVNGTTASSQNPEILFTAAGNYTISLTATNSTGVDTESKTAYINVGAAESPCLYNENFDTETNCSTADNCGLTSCPLSSSWFNRVNGSEDDIDWRVNAGTTPTTSSGPSVDNTLGTASGKYLYLEASNGCSNSEAILETGCIYLSQAYNFSFAYHMSGVDMGDLHLDLYYNSEWHEDEISPVSGNQGTSWNISNLDLSSHMGEVVKIRIRGITGSSFASDIAIDDMQFTPMASAPVSQSACASYTSPSGNYTWTSTGVYNDTIQTIAGCDSIVSIDLSIVGADNTTENITSCAAYTWSANNQTYNADGQYTATLQNVNGCDSIVTLNLSISTVASSTENVNTCGSYTWALNGQTYTSSGTHSEIVQSSTGCDSTVTLNLQINQATSATQVEEVCGSYFWPLSNQSYTTSGNYTATIANAAGCDSVVSLQLTVNNISQSASVEASCGSYIWSANNQTYTTSGNYTANLTSVQGCDSLVEIDLTINPAYNITESVLSCGDYTWVENGVTYPTSGVFVEQYTTQYGCDSVRTLDLVIDDLEADVTQQDEITLVTFTNASIQYQWVDCNNNFAPISGETGSTFVATQNGSYALIANSADCADTSACFEITTIGIEEELGFTFEVYPNPVQGNLNLSFSNVISEFSLKIYDAKGALVGEQEFTNLNELILDFPYAPGIYTLELQFENGISVKEKIVKQ